MTAMAVELALSPNADDLDVIGVGLDIRLNMLERIQIVAAGEDALARVEAAGGAPGKPEGALEADVPALHHRAALLPDAPAPTVVIFTTPIPKSVRKRLLNAGAIVIASGGDRTATLDVSDGLVTMESAGVTARRHDPDAGMWGLIHELLHATDAARFVPGPKIAALAESDPADPEPPSERDHTAPQVQVLGAVRVIRAEQEFRSARALDVITCLAFNRDGADADQLKTWVWPGMEPPTDKAFANVMSRARKGLGSDPKGDPYLSRAGSDRVYRLSPSVTTDFEHFVGLVGEADAARDQQSDTTAELAHLMDALALVRGVSFTGGGALGYAWADQTVRSHVDFFVDETVHRAADIALAVDEIDQARKAVMRGLSLIPGCEQCYERRFAVAAAEGSRAELRAAMAELQRGLEADLGEPEAGTVVSPHLLELYDWLMADIAESNQVRQQERRERQTAGTGATV